MFLARLAGVAVFDPNGDQVGRVRDFVVTLLTGKEPPRVLGLLAEVPPKRRIFLPIGRVRSFAAKEVVVSGTVNMRRFEQRAPRRSSSPSCSTAGCPAGTDGSGRR